MSTMRVILLFTLLLLCHGKPYKPINIMELMKIHDIMQQDNGSDEDDDDDDNNDDDLDNFIPDCPFGCHCLRRVVQCSDLGLMSVPRDIPADTLMIDLQNNDITEIKEDDFKKLSNLYALFLVNNQISKIHPKAFQNMQKLRLLYLSYNFLTQIPENLPKNILELRIHDNKISRIQKDAFKGMQSLHVLEMSANPIANSGIALGAFNDMATLYLRIAEARLTAIPKDLPSSLTELHLDYNKIAKVEVEDFIRYKHLLRLGLGFNQIKYVENGSLTYIPKVREIHLDNNRLKNIPPGLNSLKYLQLTFRLPGLSMNSTLPCPVFWCFDATGQKMPRKTNPTMGIPSKWSIFSLILLKAFCQDYETSYTDYDTEEEPWPEIPPLLVPEETDSSLVPSNECAKECYCPSSYPFAMYCDNRELKVIPDVPSHIRHLYVQFNKIEAITAKPFTNATSLREINLSHNNLRKVGKEAFSKLQHLTQLHLEHNNLEEIPPSLPRSLQILHLGFNKISKIPSNTIQDLINITALDLCSNRLTDEGIKGKVLSSFKSLMQINMCNNKLKTMPPDLPASLVQLLLEKNSITSIPEGYFRKTPNIMSLRVSHNRIKTIAYKAFNLSHIMELDLGYNQLSQAFFVPKNLEHLYLNHNDYKELNITLMCPKVDPDSPNMLTYIRIDHNKLRGPVDYYTYVCFPRMRMIYYGEQQTAS
ncbi:hypothetical protein QTP86_013841 [Hemibagrus guttatus]|nr:hypothetical protein QTP86_013841 [Hemibagrus guttatus]